jgi:hypothetical protein
VVRQEEGVSDQRWDHGAADDRRNQEGILHLVDDLVTQAIKGRDRPEGQTGGHQERGIGRLDGGCAIELGHGVNADHLGNELRQ